MGEKKRGAPSAREQFISRLQGDGFDDVATSDLGALDGCPAPCLGYAQCPAPRWPASLPASARHLAVIELKIAAMDDPARARLMLLTQLTISELGWLSDAQVPTAFAWLRRLRELESTSRGLGET